ncbi:phosphotransferase [Methylobacterium sp. A52T]
MPENYTLVQTLKGHSGCQVQLLRLGDNYLVRKVSASSDYNPRLIRQFKKQQRLSAIAPVARVFATDLQNGLVSFDMEYIAGRDLAAQCLGQPPSWVLNFTEQLYSMFKEFSSYTIAGDLDLNFSQKIKEIEIKLLHHPLAHKSQSTINRAISALANANWAAIPHTECHGDLTLENLIFRTDGSLVFIDVLDGELETFWLDIAKILFDLEVGWTLRDILWVDRGPAHGGRLLEIFSRYLSEQLISRVREHYPELFARLPQLKMLQALRVLPYTHDPVTFNRLTAYIESSIPLEG